MTDPRFESVDWANRYRKQTVWKGMSPSERQDFCNAVLSILNRVEALEAEA